MSEFLAYLYVTVTLVEVVETELRTVPEEDSRSMRTAPEGPVVAPEGEVATAFYRANEH